jgi:ElaB/YqjD/DUF883 family membrane-anchored ribosome-binding protein
MHHKPKEGTMNSDAAFEELLDEASTNLEQLSAAEWEALLADISAMSDDELRQLQDRADAFVEGYTSGATRALA